MLPLHYCFLYTVTNPMALFNIVSITQEVTSQFRSVFYI